MKTVRDSENVYKIYISTRATVINTWWQKQNMANKENNNNNNNNYQIKPHDTTHIVNICVEHV
jgi:hypothetical protein